MLKNILFLSAAAIFTLSAEAQSYLAQGSITYYNDQIQKVIIPVHLSARFPDEINNECLNFVSSLRPVLITSVTINGFNYSATARDNYNLPLVLVCSKVQELARPVVPQYTPAPQYRQRPAPIPQQTYRRPRPSQPTRVVVPRPVVRKLSVSGTIMGRLPIKFNFSGNSEVNLMDKCMKFLGQQNTGRIVDIEVGGRWVVGRTDVRTFGHKEACATIVKDAY